MTSMIRVAYLKLKKSELKGDIESLLRRASLLDEATRSARPESIFISKEDARVMRRNCDPWTWLNIGPSSLLEKVVKPGYALIIEGANVSAIK